MANPQNIVHRGKVNIGDIEFNCFECTPVNGKCVMQDVLDEMAKKNLTVQSVAIHWRERKVTMELIY